MIIEIIGMNCRSCLETEQKVRKVVHRLELDAEILRTDDIGKMHQYHVTHVPAVVIDGLLKSFGRVPTEQDIRGWLLLYLSPSNSFDF